MLRLTLRTLLAYLDDTLSATDSRLIGQRLAETESAQELAERIKKLIRRRGVTAPPLSYDGSPNDPNVMAAYLSDSLASERVAQFEQACLESDPLLADVASCHQILTVVLSQPVRVPPTARRRMYALVKGRESIPDRPPNPAIAPVGGIFAEETFDIEADEADAALLLGMSAYSQSESWTRRGLKVGAVLLLALGFIVTLWQAIPPLEQIGASRSLDYVLLVPLPSPPSSASTENKRSGETPPPAPPAEERPPEPRPQPMPPGKEPPAKEPGLPKVEIAVPPPPAKTDRVRAGRVDKPNMMLLAKPADMESWVRVGPTNLTVQTTDRLLALPGFKGSVVLSAGAIVELWGNLPELLPAPLLWSCVTLHDPYPGYIADLTLHDGRIYLKSQLPEGGKIRLRFAPDQVWELTLPNDQTEVAVELIRTAVPGDLAELPQVTVGFAVNSGTAALKVGYKQFPKIEVNQVVHWDNKGPGLEGPKKLPPEGVAYFSKFQTYPDAANAQAALLAINKFTERLTDPSRVRVVFAEGLSVRGTVNLEAIASARIAVLAEAAMNGEPGLTTLVEAAEDPARPFVREAALFGLRAALLAYPEAQAKLATILEEKARLTSDEIATLQALLRGLTPAERNSPDTGERLLALLDANKIILREAAFMILLNEVDPESQKNRQLASFDAAAPEMIRQQILRAWKRRLDELKKKEPPAPKMP
jgi:hypothetical protein